MSFPILYHNELSVSSIEKKFEKTIAQLQSGDFNSADVRKMGNVGFYRARLDIKDRLLFTLVQYNEQTHILLLEIILNHNYASSRFLRGAMLPGTDEALPLIKKIEDVTDKIPQLTYLHPKNKSVYYLNKFISFDSIQQSSFSIKPPIIIIGSAGSGKTALVLEKLKTLNGTVAYVSLSKFLVENASKMYFSNGYFNEEQEVAFLSLTDYLNSWQKVEGKEVTFRQFEGWFNKFAQALKINEPYRVFEEFKGVISGTPTDTAYLTQENYVALGVKQSIFSVEDRVKLYPLYLKYIDWLNDNNYYDGNLICHQYLQFISPKYDYIMVDEVQDFTNIQLQCILQALTNPQHFILTGDSNQIVHPNFFSWSKVKTYFHNSSSSAKQIQILQTNYRNSQQVVDLSNNLLKIKNSRFGSIDKESNYLINTNSTAKGEVILYTDDDKKKNELNKRTQNSTQFAVIVTDNILKEEAKKYFKTPLVFSVQEAKGLEYENVILVNFISNHSSEFKEIINGVNREDLLQEELVYSRSANKNDKDAEIYKFYINSFYVAITRSIKNIYLFEKQIQHPALQLLQMQESKKDVNVAEIKSSKEEWLEEARRLEEQGKYEQAEQIRAKYLGYEYISLEDIEAMLALALDATKKEHEVKKERKQVFQYATTHNKINWIEQLAALQFQRANLFMKEVKMHRKDLAKNIRLGNVAEAQKSIDKYGIDFCVEDNVNCLMLALHHGQPKMIAYLLAKNINLNQQDINQKIGSHYLLEGFFKTTILKHQQCATLQHLRQFWYSTKPQSIKYNFLNMQITINSYSMLYYLIILMQVKEKTQENRVSRKEESGLPPLNLGYFDMDDFEKLCAMMPNEVLPEYRRNRSYINSVVASNEIDKLIKTATGKGTFIRISRGTYILNPEIGWGVSKQ